MAEPDLNEVLEELLLRLDQIELITKAVQQLPSGKHGAQNIYKVLSVATGLSMSAHNRAQFAEVLLANGWKRSVQHSWVSFEHEKQSDT